MRIHVNQVLSANMNERYHSNELSSLELCRKRSRAVGYIVGHEESRNLGTFGLPQPMGLDIVCHSPPCAFVSFL